MQITVPKKAFPSEQDPDAMPSDSATTMRVWQSFVVRCATTGVTSAAQSWSRKRKIGWAELIKKAAKSRTEADPLAKKQDKVHARRVVKEGKMEKMAGSITTPPFEMRVS
ncbi:hypothetical protein M436DRAFT_61426 [Aureobasidium namibiae CBS 147.97]|uniref:Uncharacterized protein n=1 Tax=Aureobasidium namibiae CBS 147.97 TaxID=1043004 RepID=A0A074X2D2_9PEZI